MTSFSKIDCVLMVLMINVSTDCVLKATISVSLNCIDNMMRGVCTEYVLRQKWQLFLQTLVLMAVISVSLFRQWTEGIDDKCL